MIQFTLKCDKGHRFESWFQSSAAFDSLQGQGLVTCAVCGSSTITKALMAPSVQAARKKASAPAPRETEQPTVAEAAAPLPPAEALQRFKAHVESTSDYVGGNFVREARDMHAGLTKERSIYGEAKPEEARALIEEGVPVMPLPFLPTRKTN